MLAGGRGGGDGGRSQFQRRGHEGSTVYSKLFLRDFVHFAGRSISPAAEAVQCG